MFHREDTDTILRIPPSYRYISDAMFWMNNKIFLYSVKSNYHVACQLARVKDWVEASTGTFEKDLWKNFWSLRIPNKIMVLGWRACKDVLPTKL